MESLFILIPLALFFCGVAIAAFFWAVDRRQFDDLDHVGQQILFDNERLDDQTLAPRLRTPAPETPPQPCKDDHA